MGLTHHLRVRTCVAQSLTNSSCLSRSHYVSRLDKRVNEEYDNVGVLPLTTLSSERVVWSHRIHASNLSRIPRRIVLPKTRCILPVSVVLLQTPFMRLIPSLSLLQLAGIFTATVVGIDDNTSNSHQDDNSATVIYASDVAVLNGKKLWYPEWRMKELMQEQQQQKAQMQKNLEADNIVSNGEKWNEIDLKNMNLSIDRRFNGDIDEDEKKQDDGLMDEFYLTDEEIDELLFPSAILKKKQGIRYEQNGDTGFNEEDSLEMRIEKVLQSRVAANTKKLKISEIYNHDYSVAEEYVDINSLNDNDYAEIVMKGQQHSKPDSRDLHRTNKKQNIFMKTKKNGSQGMNGVKKRGKRGRNKRGKRGNGKQTKTQKYQNRKSRDICLYPPDRFRTCLSRKEDPSNDITGCDKILRNQYNLGAVMYRRGNEPKPPPPELFYTSEGKFFYYYPEYVEPPKPYTRPYIEDDEILTQGSMHISLMQENTRLGCSEKIRVEETILKYLQQNVGDDDTFRPACVFLEDESVNEQIVRGADGRVATATTIKVNVMYRTKKRFQEKLDRVARVRRRMLEDEWKAQNGTITADGVFEERPVMRRLMNTCDTANHHLCCSQDSINGDVGNFCKTLGCDFQSCGGRRLGGSVFSGGSKVPGLPQQYYPNQPNRPNRFKRPGIRGNAVRQILAEEYKYDESWIDKSSGSIEKKLEQLYLNNQYSNPDKIRRVRQNNNNNCQVIGFEGKDFDQVMRQNTVFKQVDHALSLLNDTDSSKVAACSVNWYIVNNGGIPASTCDEYEEQNCKNNEDLTFEKDSVRCLEPSSEPSAAPSSMPSNLPSSMPSNVPSSLPSKMPSNVPSVDPTYIPTLSPTYNPTLPVPSEMPSSSPSFFPSTAPSFFPSTAPSLSPTLLPSDDPSVSPTDNPTLTPTKNPTLSPTDNPTVSPTDNPTVSPTDNPTVSPTDNPTDYKSI